MEAPHRPMPHGQSRGSIVGLTTALQKYLDKYFEARRKKGGEVCPGEELCAVTGPLRDKSRPIDAICSKCEMLPTKPGTMPGTIATIITSAYRMEALFDSGALTQYPNFYTSLEWEAFLTLKMARTKDQEKEIEARQKIKQQGNAQAALEARLNRKN